eukprot:CAMPEP_0179704828 /NCGR_PEP_ID=MMETSP0937-20121108/3518_1 /TAXON_ID=548131 ORGANISM="Ostreococcus mediterraneus, Strain clade-D-RCC2593" /NCGR_SAMPLE_ID=MMETSP0937 /ASSEMBLY_ACC=CAM_ASM_000575 /LENGTH=74 /DNA_ID=CAMNT_0021578053 /DNA_START=109 /DNA_END=333 /DNA_ORIENTATION=+
MSTIARCVRFSSLASFFSTSRFKSQFAFFGFNNDGSTSPVFGANNVSVSTFGVSNVGADAAGILSCTSAPSFGT